jgi:aquaporin Z
MTQPDNDDGSEPGTDRGQARRHELPGPPTAARSQHQPGWVGDFTDLSYEWRRLFSELFGTFFLVLAAGGAAVIQDRSAGQIGRIAEVTAPALTVLVVILFMGAVSGAHLNPIVSIAFALRHDFQWRRVPGYIVAQLLGALLAALLLRATFGNVAHLGATLPGTGFSTTQAFIIEVVLSAGLVSTILGTASTAQNLGPLSALGVGGYIALAGLWASPVSGASMNPARSAGPAVASADVHQLWIYLTAPPIGMLIAVAAAQILRGPGGGPAGTRAAQGSLPDTPAAASTADPTHRRPTARRRFRGSPARVRRVRRGLPR